MKRALIAATTFALLAPASAFARGDFDPTTEFEQHEWIPIHLGSLNLSITKAVAYLMLGTVLTILMGLGLMRWKVTGNGPTDCPCNSASARPLKISMPPSVTMKEGIRM